MHSTTLSNSFSSSFIHHPYNCSLLRIRTSSSAQYYQQLLPLAMGALQLHVSSLSAPQNCPAAPMGHLFSLALTIAPLVLLSLRLESRPVSVKCFCALCQRVLGKYFDIQADSRGEETELCVLYLSPAWKISNFLSYYKNGLQPLLLNAYITILNFPFID